LDIIIIIIIIIFIISRLLDFTYVCWYGCVFEKSMYC